MKVIIKKMDLEFKQTFNISDHIFNSWGAVRVTLQQNGVVGRGEGACVYYLNETADSMFSQLESIRGVIERGITRLELLEIMPTGGARNALDSALWDLEIKQSKQNIWQQLLLIPKKLVSVATIGINEASIMADNAKQLDKYSNLKIKLGADDPITKLEAIRSARPDASLIIDVNQGWSFAELKEYSAPAQKLGVAMIEQPLARGGDDELVGYQSIIPLGADESCLNLNEFDDAISKYQVVNIKLDKCGGLTEALQIIDKAKRESIQLMVGNMSGTSLSMAPAYVVGQFCQFIDIDGPLILAQDIENGLDYGEGGVVSMPTPELWG